MAPAGGIDGGAVGALRTAASRATGVEYDCALLNKYPDGASAMRYHSDPDHGAQTDVGNTAAGGSRRACETRAQSPPSCRGEDA